METLTAARYRFTNHYTIVQTVFIIPPSSPGGQLTGAKTAGPPKPGWAAHGELDKPHLKKPPSSKTMKEGRVRGNHFSAPRPHTRQHTKLLRKTHIRRSPPNHMHEYTKHNTHTPLRTISLRPGLHTHITCAWVCITWAQQDHKASDSTTQHSTPRHDTFTGETSAMN